MKTVNGIAYYRRKKRMSKAGLASASGLSWECINGCEALDSVDNCCMDTILAIATALEVTVDQLLETHDAGELTRADKAFFPGAQNELSNPIAVYRTRENLTFRELAQRLETSPWGANLICRRDEVNDKYIRQLAEWEGLSPEQFLALYDGAWEGGVPHAGLCE